MAFAVRTTFGRRVPLETSTRNRPIEIREDMGRERRKVGAASSRARGHGWNIVRLCDDDPERRSWLDESLESLERWEAEHGLGEGDDV